MFVIARIADLDGVRHPCHSGFEHGETGFKCHEARAGLLGIARRCLPHQRLGRRDIGLERYGNGFERGSDIVWQIECVLRLDRSGKTLGIVGDFGAGGGRHLTIADRRSIERAINHAAHGVMHHIGEHLLAHRAHQGGGFCARRLKCPADQKTGADQQSPGDQNCATNASDNRPKPHSLAPKNPRQHALNLLNEPAMCLAPETQGAIG